MDEIRPLGRGGRRCPQVHGSGPHAVKLRSSRSPLSIRSMPPRSSTRSGKSIEAHRHHYNFPHIRLARRASRKMSRLNTATARWQKALVPVLPPWRSFRIRSVVSGSFLERLHLPGLHLRFDTGLMDAGVPIAPCCWYFLRPHRQRRRVDHLHRHQGVEDLRRHG